MKNVEKIATLILEAYKFRVKRQRRSRGVTRSRRRLYYRHHKPVIKRKHKIYRQRTKSFRRQRSRLKHYKRFG